MIHLSKQASKIILSLILISITQAYTYAANGNLTIQQKAGPWPIKIKTCAHDAGAICSLTWRNKEFVDDFDHGRQIQSALVYDRLGESFNPTEAGGSYDGHNIQPSSSILLGARINSRNSLSTSTNMAFWNPVNGRRVSNTVLDKKVTIGAFGLAHVIEYLTTFNLPTNENHTHAQFEIVTGYMPYEFSKYWTYNVKNKVLRPLSYGPGEQGLPVIISTNDQGWAMGIYSPDHKSYGRFRFGGLDRVSKWNNVARISNPKKGGAYSFRSYIIVGSLENVKVSMDQLYRKLGQ